MFFDFLIKHSNYKTFKCLVFLNFWPLEIFPPYFGPRLRILHSKITPRVKFWGLETRFFIEHCKNRKSKKVVVSKRRKHTVRMKVGGWTDRRTDGPYAQMLILIIFFLLKILKFQNFNFLAVILVPGLLKQLEETCRIHSHHSWYLESFMVPTYEQNTVEFND